MKKIQDKFEDNAKILAIKEDISLLKADILNVREMVANNKAEIIKWMFIFWIGQVAVTFSFILPFLRK